MTRDGVITVLRFSEEPLLSITRRPGPNMKIEEFGAKYHLSDKIVSQLNDRGYATVGSVRFATVSDLKLDGFKQGQISQLKHVLDTWSPKNEGEDDRDVVWMINLRFSEETLLSKIQRPEQNMRIEEFGAKYHLSDKLVSKLDDCGYDTVGSLCFAVISDLEADGFKQGQINQLKHALDWSSNNMDFEGEDELLSIGSPPSG